VKDPFSLYKNLKLARISANVSQKELAEKLGLSDRAISAYETGRAIPPSSTLARIAEILNVSVSEIVGEGNLPTERIENLERRVANLEQAMIRYLKEK
jgi:transcriptional regulator with XRE-family HTH domain